MKQVIILRYGEIYLKGKNKSFFESLLIKNIKKSLSLYKFNLIKISGRLIVNNYNETDEVNIIEKLKKVFGLVSISKGIEIDTDLKKIEDYCRSIKVTVDNFRVSVNRADKTFSIKSPDYEAILGGYILDNNPHLKVKLKNPDLEVMIEIRENAKTYVFTEKIICAGGIPVGSSGNGLLLLSGGIDSPVAGYMLSKRGMKISALHFHSYPYTSERAKDKVLKLAESLREYTINLRVYIVNFKEIQEEIHKNCKEEYMVTLMRRFMMRIAGRISKSHNIQAIITGESLGQVASQTIEGITSSNSVVPDIPVLRPLIGMDKSEIIEIASKIGTFETSILPYEDCCTVFLPKNPIIKPKIYNVEYEESRLDIDALINRAMSNIEIID